MNLINQGLDKRTDDVTLLISRDKDVAVAQADYDKCIKKLIAKFGDDNLFSELDEVFNNLSYFETYATYRIALADGMQLQQEISSLANSVKAVIAS